MKRKLMQSSLAIALVCGLLLGARAWAISSANYRLDWFTPLTGGGGGPVSSANYKANFTIGQTAIGKVSSANYRVGLGYWYGMDLTSLYLPAIER
jgi:hypothetical protein